MLKGSKKKTKLIASRYPASQSRQEIWLQIQQHLEEIFTLHFCF